MEKKVLVYGDEWIVESTKNLFKVYWLPYDEDTSMGIKKSCVTEILQNSTSFELEPELVAILFAAVKFNRKTVSPSNKCRSLKDYQIAEGLTALLNTWDDFDYDDVLNVFISARTQDVESLITSSTPKDWLADFLHP